MNVLEKILEEIEDIFDENTENIEDLEGTHHFAINVSTAKYIVDKVICSHMDDMTDTNVCSKSDWIPYSEQSNPKKDGIYLVTCDDEEYPVKRMRFKECLWYWTYGIYNGKILAWQSLPEPYKGEEAAG